MMLSEFWEAFQPIINALFTGFGVAIGLYLANNHLIKPAQELAKALKRPKAKES